MKNPSIRNTTQIKQEQAELKDLYVETILKIEKLKNIPPREGQSEVYNLKWSQHL